MIYSAVSHINYLLAWTTLNLTLNIGGVKNIVSWDDWVVSI